MIPPQKIAEILVVGNELLNGTTMDTNSFWLSKQLNEIGFKVERKTTIRDDLKAISENFRDIIRRKPDWLFSIGGLGPTFDDLTIQGLGMAVGQKLKLNNDAVEMLRQNYKRRALKLNLPKRRLTRARLKMATIPELARPIQNPVGSAPGVLVGVGKTSIVSLPGVPNEMKGIFRKELLSVLRKTSQYFTSEKWLRTVGISESSLAPLVGRIFHEHGDRLYIKSHPRGFERGQPVINIQIILNVPLYYREAGLKELEVAIGKMGLAARNIGASIKSFD
jgi:molybdenum cofactor synthesis domain-containing protein